MGLTWDNLRRMPMAAWRAYEEAFVEAERGGWQRAAWQSSLQLIAAGCKAEDVAPAKLLGEEKQLTIRQRIAQDPEAKQKKAAERVVARMRAAREKEK